MPAMTDTDLEALELLCSNVRKLLPPGQMAGVGR